MSQMMSPCTGPVTIGNRINAENTFSQLNGQLAGGNDFQSQFVWDPMPCFRLLVHYQFSLLSQSVTGLTPQIPFYSLFCYCSLLFNYSDFAQGLNGRLMKHEVKLNCCCNTTCICRHLNWKRVWPFCGHSVWPFLSYKCNILVGFLRHLVLYFLLNKGTGRGII